MATSIKLQSSDGEVFQVDVEIAQKSITIKTMLEDLGLTEEDNDIPVPLPNVNAAILKKVLEWATHHKNKPVPSEDDKSISDWDAKFLAAVGQGTLFELIMAANYLDIKDLLRVATLSVANQIKGKTPQEIRNTFNIELENDLPDKTLFY